MTDQKNPQNETVDWAQRLKASMNQAPEERATPAPVTEEDDLAALLRAQLAHRAESADTAVYHLDTSEFEEEDGENTDLTENEEIDTPADLLWDDTDEESPTEDSETSEPAEDGETTAPDEREESDTSADLPWDETAEASPAEEENTAPDESEESDTPADLPWNETAEESPTEDSETSEPTEDSETSEPAEDSETSEPAEDGETTAPDESEESDSPADLPWDETAEESPAEGESTEPTEEESSAPEVSPSNRYKIEYIPYEEWGESLPSPDGAVGDPRLAAAAEESARLLEEEPADERPFREPLPAEADVPAETEPVAPPPVRKAKPAETVADPLQLGLDDVFPRVESLPPMDKASQPPKKQRDYTARMGRAPGEEAVQDTEMYLRLGYEEQMTRSERQDAVEEARRRAREQANRAARNETASVKSRREYTGMEQTPAIERAYTRARRLGMTRLCVAAVGALFGILYDYLGGMTRYLSSLTLAGSVLYPIIGLLWTALICLPFLSRLGKGLKSLVDFEPTRYAVSALALLVSAANSALSIFTHSPYLYGGVALFMLTVAAASEYVTAVAEHSAFSVVSSGKTTFVLTDEPTSASAGRSKTEGGERALTALRAERLSDYFARTGRYNPYMGRMNYLIPMSLLAAIICAGAAILRGGTLSADGIPVFTAAFLSCLPAAYLMAMSLPLFRANGLLKRKGSAVIGTAAAVDYTKRGSARLLIRDGDALWGLHRKEITLRDDPNAAHWRGLSAQLFRLLECPLWVESPLGEDSVDGLCVEVAETEEGYARLYLIDTEKGETTEVMMGFREALSRRGVRLPKASMERVYKKTEESRVIYLAFDRRFRIAYAVEYRVGQTFARAVEKLASLGDFAALVTYDPLVSPALLKQEPFETLPAVELLRPDYVEPIRKARSGGVIATGRSLDLLYPYAACHRMRRVYRLSHILSWIAILAATGLFLLTVLVGRGDILSCAAVTVWQILLTAVSAVMSLTAVTRRSLFIPRDPGSAVHGRTKDAPRQAPETTDTKTDKETSST